MAGKSTKYYILTGLISILPLTATYWIVVKLFHFFSRPGASIVEFIFADKVPLYVPQIAGFILTLLFIYLIGTLKQFRIAFLRCKTPIIFWITLFIKEPCQLGELAAGVI